MEKSFLTLEPSFRNDISFQLSTWPVAGQLKNVSLNPYGYWPRRSRVWASRLRALLNGLCKPRLTLKF